MECPPTFEAEGIFGAAGSLVDNEIIAIGDVHQAMRLLSREQQERVFSYLNTRYDLGFSQ